MHNAIKQILPHIIVGEKYCEILFQHNSLIDSFLILISIDVRTRIIPMDQTHINIFELHDWLNALTDLQLLRRLMEYGILPKEGEYLCEKCQQPFSLRVDNSTVDKYRWFCDNYVVQRKQKRTRCNFKKSIRSGTFFAKSHLSLGVILKFIHFWVHNTPLNVTSFNLHIAAQTGVDFANFCREVVYDQMVLHSNPLGGPGSHVEIDESKFGRRKYNRGHRVQGQWVFGGFQRESGEIFMVPVETRDRSTLLPIIEKWILPGTTIHSDFWRAYDCLDDEGYNHLKVNHSLEYVDKETGACTNHIEASWRVAKKHCDVGGRKKEFFAGYLAKYMFLKKCKLNHWDPFLQFLRLAGQVYDATKNTTQDEETTATTDSDKDDDEYIDCM